MQECLAPDFQQHHLPLPPLPTTVEAIQFRLQVENLGRPKNVQRPLAEAEQLVQLKTEIIEAMDKLDPLLDQKSK